MLLWQEFYLSGALPPPPWPILLYVYTIQYTYSHWEEGELAREKVKRAIVHNTGRKYQHKGLYLQTINSFKHQ